MDSRIIRPFVHVALAAGLCLAGWETLSAQQAVTPTAPAGAAATPVRIPGVEPPVTTFWQKLGIPQNYMRIRDGLLNRRGNLPFLERKPPVLKIADPRNLAADKPQMIQAAAKIKQAEDMKKQKIKALKFLGDMNCGCYNKDGKVEAAFLEAIEDCDPDVRMAAIRALTDAAGGGKRCSHGKLKAFCESCRKLCKHGGLRDHCQQCRGGCESCGQSQCCGECCITCCTQKLQEKLEKIAHGMDEYGCWIEPVAEIRAAAEQLLCICPCPKIHHEELLRPDPEIFRREEILRPEPFTPGEREISSRHSHSILNDESLALNVASGRSYYSSSATPAVPASLAGFRLTDGGALRQDPQSRIENPERLIHAMAVQYRTTLGEVLVELPFVAELKAGWTVVLVDPDGVQAIGRITEVGGRRILVTLDCPDALRLVAGSTVRMGLIAR